MAALGSALQDELTEADRFLPTNNVLRLMRLSLPPGCKISSEVKERMIEITTELIGFVTNHAIEEHMMKAKRKTLTRDDFLQSLHELDLHVFVPPLNTYLNRKPTQTAPRKRKKTQQNTNAPQSNVRNGDQVAQQQPNSLGNEIRERQADADVVQN